MTIESLKTSLQAHFNTGWADRTPVHWPNVRFDPPTDEAWVRYQEIPVDSDFASIGSVGNNVCTRDIGQVVITVFVPLKSTTLELDQHIDVIMGIFRGQSVGTALFRQPRRNGIGPDNEWFQEAVICPYQFDEFY